MPLPPQVSGPLTVASRGVWVSGALNGAQIQLRSNGAEIGPSVASTGPSTFVGPAGGLVAGSTITATQILNGVSSEPSPFGQIVAGLPDMPTGLPAPVYLSGLHTLVDWVRLGGLFPGATVEVRDLGQLIGSVIAGLERRIGARALQLLAQPWGLSRRSYRTCQP